MDFSGTVQSRSSGKCAKESGPPGEAEVLRLNPRRELRLKAAMDWGSVEPGTLNLSVENTVLEQLLEVWPQVIEEASEVVYPSPYEQIPERRAGYLYYRARLRATSGTETVLVRRARNPVKGRVEVFAEINLRDALGLSDGDVVEVNVYSSH